RILGRGVDVIDLPFELHGNRLLLAEILVVFRLLRAGQPEVILGELHDLLGLGILLGRDRGIDPAPVLEIERLGADLGVPGLERSGLIPAVEGERFPGDRRGPRLFLYLGLHLSGLRTTPHVHAATAHAALAHAAGHHAHAAHAAGHAAHAARAAA